jgi:hypothetical protein
LDELAKDLLSIIVSLLKVSLFGANFLAILPKKFNPEEFNRIELRGIRWQEKQGNI